MPNYEYAGKCGHRFEVIQKFNDLPIFTCLKCGGVVERVISPSTLVFNGSGWTSPGYN